VVKRKIIAYTNRFLDFYTEQDNKVQEKIEYVLDLVRFEERVPIKFLKYLENTDSIYEVRVNTTFKNIRILCFFDKGNLLVLTNCLVKKAQKTPRKEIIMAEKLKKAYLTEKYGGGTPERDKYEANSLAFRLGVMLKEARQEARITQEELAMKTGTKKSYISRIERGKSDIQVSTYHKLIEIGLGKNLNITIG